jgi:NADH-quinone oxidoreductase subunit M
MFWMGLYPQPFLRKMDASVNKLINQINQKKTLFTEAKKEPRLLWDIKTIENTAEDHQEKEEPVQ